MNLMKLILLVCATLAVDSTAVSSLDISPREQRAVFSPRPLILLVTSDGAAGGGVALTAH